MPFQAAEVSLDMISKALLSFPGALALFAAGSIYAQAQSCPRADCPNPGQNCPRNGQGMRQCAGNAQRGPAAMNNRGMRRGRMMTGGSGSTVAAPAVPENRIEDRSSGRRFACDRRPLPGAGAARTPGRHDRRL